MADLNIAGHKVSPLAAGAIGVGSLVVIWFAWKQHQASAASSTSASAIDSLTGLPTSQDNATDPLTGMTYLAEAQEYGSVSAAEQSVAGESSLGYSAAYGTGSGLVGSSTGQDLVPGNVVQGTSYASNAAWAQAVEAGLTDIGYAPTDIAAALGRYLGNLSETAAQAGIVQAAIAEYGPPPVGSFLVIMAAPTGPTSSGGTSRPSSAPGLSVTPAKGKADFGWSTIASATSYELVVTGAGGKGTGTSHVDQQEAGNHAEGVALAKGKYKAQVRAMNTAGDGPYSAAKAFTVT